MAIVFAQPIEQYPQHLAFSTTPTMTNGDALFPASRLANYDPTSVTRTTTGSTVITWDFGLNREFDVVALIYTNTSYGCTLVIDASLNGSTWTTLRASGPLWAHRTSVPGSWSGEINDPRWNALPRNSSWFQAATVQTYRYVRLTISDPNVSILTFGRLFVGKSFSPSIGYQYGSAFNFEDTGMRQRTAKGPNLLDYGCTYVSAGIKLDFLTTTEMYDYAYEFNYWRGSSSEMLVCLDTTDVPRLQKNIIYGTISDGRSITSDTYNIYSQTWIVESIA